MLNILEFHSTQECLPNYYIVIFFKIYNTGALSFLPFCPIVIKSVKLTGKVLLMGTN